MKSEQFSLSLSLSHHCANSLVQFFRGCLAPSRRHGILFPSDWSIFNMPRPPTLRISGPRHSMFSSLAARGPSPAYTELVEVLADEPCESQSSKLYECFLSGSGLCPTRRKLPFFPDRHHKVSRSRKQPFCSRLTNEWLSPTSLVLWRRVKPQFLWPRTR